MVVSMQRLKNKIIESIISVLFISCFGFCGQVSIPRVELMPNEPSPYVMRDWKQVALDYDEYVFSFTKTSSSPESWWQDYPIIWWDTVTPNYNFPWDGFGMPSYIGMPSMNGSAPHGHEAINCIGAVIGGTLCGIDKSSQWCSGTSSYEDWVIMEQQYYGVYTGENLALNYTLGDSGQTFWYDIMPTILFCQLLAEYPGTGDMEMQMYAMADLYYNAEVVMGGSTDPWTVPDFTHTAFDYDTMSPVDNGKWVEPDAAAGYAWLEYMAYVKWDSPQHLTGADWAIQYLEDRTVNPLYELLLPYGVLTAARMNAEQGRNYDVYKLINWCFEPSDAPVGQGRPGWGVIADDPWGGYDCDGLVGSVTDGGGYAFAMNTYHWAAALTPVVRYDQDYARAIGKWMLNAANASRLFYANGLDADHQSSEWWAYTYDPNNCVSYEGLRKNGRFIDKAISDYNPVYGDITFNYENTWYINDGKYQILKEERIGIPARGKVEHVWDFNITPGTSHYFRMNGYYMNAGSDDTGFDFFWSISPAGPWIHMFKVDKTSPNTDYYGYGLPSGLSGPLYIMAKDEYPNTYDSGFDTLYVDSMFVWTETDSTFSPYAMGDGISSFPRGTQTDFATYGASHVGMLGAIVETTNVEKILQLDLLATDYYHDNAYPTYLYYNPYLTSQAVEVNVGDLYVDIYDTVTQEMLEVNVTGVTSIDIPADSAVVTVLVPAGGLVTIDGSKKLIDDVIVDYKTNTTFSTCGQIQASPNRLRADVDGNCVVDIQDLHVLSGDWLTLMDAGRTDINRDTDVNIEDLVILSSEWLAENSF